MAEPIRHRATLLLVNDRLQARFENQGKDPLTVVLGEGEPDFRLLDSGSIWQIEAGFICPYEYEHDCFHSRLLTISPGQAETVVFRSSPPQELRTGLLSRKVHVCDYLTVTPDSVPEPEPPGAPRRK